MPCRRLARLSLLLTIIWFSSLPWAPCHADQVRAPAVAGLWYPDNRVDLERMLDELAGRARKTVLAGLPTGGLKALILPHAGFVYSGWTAAHASLVLQPRQFDKVVLVGPDHRIGFSGVHVSDATAYETPLGSVPLHPDTGRLRNQSALFRSIAASDRQEHSLEAVLPFLQHSLGSFRLVPLVVGDCPIPPLVASLEPILEDDTLLVISSDLSHYLPYEAAVRQDRQTLQLVLSLEADRLALSENCACGKLPILALLAVAQHRHWRPFLLHYANSGDTAGTRDRVVGYAALAFFEEPKMSKTPKTTEPLDDEHGRRLVLLARQAIAEALDMAFQPTSPAANPAGVGAASKAETRCGTFVTLKKNGRLRGCIGNLAADKPIEQGVRDNAVHAAFHDHRFPPLSPDEFDLVEISVSVLSPPEPLAYRDADDLCRRLRAGVDGVVIRRGAASATFLPQVWEQLPTPQDFLSQLCLKAGLPPDAWRSGTLEVSTYQVQHFEEHH